MIAAAISPYREIRAEGARAGRAVGRFVEVYVATLARRVRPARRQGPLREGASPARSRTSPASTTRTRRPRAPRSSSTPRARRPRSRPQVVIAKLEELGLIPAQVAGVSAVAGPTERLITPHGGELVDRHRRPRPTDVDVAARPSQLDLARALRPRDARRRRAVAARGLHGPGGLRVASSRTCASRTGCRGRCRSASPSTGRRKGDRVALARRVRHAARRPRGRGRRTTYDKEREARALLPHDRREAPGRRAALRAAGRCIWPARCTVFERVAARSSPSSRSTRPRRARPSPSAAGSASSASRPATRSTARTST